MDFLVKKEYNFLNMLDEKILIINKYNEFIYINAKFKNDLKEFEYEEDTLKASINLFVDGNKMDYNYLKKNGNLNRVEAKLKLKNEQCKDIIVSTDNINFYDEEAFIIIINKLFNKKDECELKVKTNLLQKTLLLFPSIIIMKKADKIIYVNKEAEKVLDVGNSKDIVGKKLNEVLAIETVENGKNKNIFFNNLDYKNKLHKSKVKIKTFNNKEIFVEIFLMSFYECNEEITVIVAKDISKKIKMEENLRKSHEYYKRLLEFVPYGVAIINNSKINFANETFVSILGVKSVKEVLKKDIGDFINKDEKKLIDEIENNIYNNLKQEEFRELKVSKKDGSEQYIEIGAAPFINNSNLSTIIVVNDITERKIAEINKYKLNQALKYDKLKTEFIANMSHELKTPLNIILSIVQLVELKYIDKNREDKSSIYRYINVMKQNCYRLLRLINNLIDISKIDVGTLKMNFGNYDIVKVVEDITMSTVEYIESKGLKLIFDTNVEEKIISVDREKMERVILNLLSNAVKFSKDNGIIEVNVQVDEIKGVTNIIVKDDGIGIAKNMQEKIFERFVQTSPLFTRTNEGSGIGLSLVKSIVDNHKGRIYVESEENIGSKFIVEIPNTLCESKTLLSESLNKKDKLMNSGTHYVEKIMIEFSDIYG